MKKLLLLTVLVVLTACSGVKKTQEALNTGNYPTAMSKAIAELSENKTKKGHQEYVILLEKAFQKYSQRENERIAFLKKDGNPANFEAIYNGYVQLKNWQEHIKPLLPLPIYEENREAFFAFNNYDNKIIESKDELSSYLYDNASRLLKNANDKYDYRKAYDELSYLNRINPGYGDTELKMEEAYNKGLEFVQVDINNDTEQIIPARLEEELLDFNTYGLDNFWTQYHTNPLETIAYDYAMTVDFKEINISPEQINEKQIIKEKQVKDGYEYLYDEEGNVVKDSLGNKIKVDRLVTVRCDFYQFTQFKSAQIGAKVSFTDLRNGQTINSYPLASEFVFEHIYANYEGDRRALDNDLARLLKLGAVPFPTNEQMVYDAGEELKARLKEVVKRHSFN